MARTGTAGRNRLWQWGPLAVLATAGTVLRVMTVLGFPQPLWTPDSASYIQCAQHPAPLPDRPCGYSFFIKIFEPFHSVMLVVIVQHALGLAAGAALYLLLLRRYGVHPLIAAVAALPMFLDSYIIGLEHFFLSDAIFWDLLLAAVIVMLWPRRPDWRTAAVAGLLLGCASEVRTAGLPLLLLFLGYVLLRALVEQAAWWRGLVTAIALFGTATLPVVAYTVWATSSGQPATGPAGAFLYGRVAVFADCTKIRPQGELAALCPQSTTKDWVSARYVWDEKSPIYLISSDPFAPDTSTVASQFAQRAILAQPGDYAHVVLQQSLMAFEPRALLPDLDGYTGVWYRFDFPATHLPVNGYSGGLQPGFDSGTPPAVRQGPYDQWMINYQDFADLPGPLLGAALLVGLMGIVRRWRDGGGAALLPWAVALGLLIVPIMTVDYDFRYVLPMIPFAFMAAAMAFAQKQSRDA